MIFGPPDGKKGTPGISPWEDLDGFSANRDRLTVFYGFFFERTETGFPTRGEIDELESASGEAHRLINNLKELRVISES